ncbi:ABC transporter permease [Actinopolyspora sp. H202]|uniref:ABC transporter permease n=1 Tax=Actinopolyspora sp. H202 TaxID=1500456 RepID=UPI003EE744F5
MKGLIRAEFRKMLPTPLWWALLIPVAPWSLLVAWYGTAIGQVEMLQEITGRALPTGLLAMSLATNYSTIFAALLGALIMTRESWNKTITTTFLTANPRSSVLGAKLVLCLALSVVYGLVNAVFGLLGGYLGGSLGNATGGVGGLEQWLIIGGAGVLATVLWALLGFGFGALVNSSVAAVLVLVFYKFMVDVIASIWLAGSEFAWLSGYLPGAASNGIVGNLAVPMFISEFAGPRESIVPKQAFEQLHAVFGGDYGFAWWGSALVFAGYAALFCGGAMLLVRNREIN